MTPILIFWGASATMMAFLFFVLPNMEGVTSSSNSRQTAKPARPQLTNHKNQHATSA